MDSNSSLSARAAGSVRAGTSIIDTVTIAVVIKNDIVSKIVVSISVQYRQIVRVRTGVYVIQKTRRVRDSDGRTTRLKSNFTSRNGVGIFNHYDEGISVWKNHILFTGVGRVETVTVSDIVQCKCNRISSWAGVTQCNIVGSTGVGQPSQSADGVDSTNYSRPRLNHHSLVWLHQPTS